MTYLSTWMVKIDLTGETKKTEHEVVLKTNYDGMAGTALEIKSRLDAANETLDGLRAVLRKIAKGEVMRDRETHTHIDTVIEYQKIASAALGLGERPQTTDRWDCGHLRFLPSDTECRVCTTEMVGRLKTPQQMFEEDMRRCDSPSASAAGKSGDSK